MDGNAGHEPSDDADDSGVPDHYGALGLARGADPETIAAAYEARVGRLRQRQQDAKDPDTLMAAQFDLEALDEAYETLSRSEERAAYDARLDALVARGGTPRPSVRPVAAATPFMLAALLMLIALAGVIFALLGEG